MRIRELEDKLKLLKASTGDRTDEIKEGHQKAELMRAKQDMVNRIIQIGEKVEIHYYVIVVITMIIITIIKNKDVKTIFFFISQ